MNIECIGCNEAHYLHEIKTDNYQVENEDTVITLHSEMVNISDDSYECLRPVSSWLGKK